MGWFNRATSAEVQAGLAWYNAAKNLAYTVATTVNATHHTRYTQQQVSGVIAALSPRVVWADQERFTLGLVEAHAQGRFNDAPHPGFRTNREKARRILDGEAPLDVLGGEKVRAFYVNITGQDRAIPTLDIWAVRAAVHMPIGFEGVGYLLGQKNRRTLLVGAYVEAAAEVEIAVCDFQAVVWVVARNWFRNQEVCTHCGGPLHEYTCKTDCWRSVWNVPRKLNLVPESASTETLPTTATLSKSNGRAKAGGSPRTHTASASRT